MSRAKSIHAGLIGLCFAATFGMTTGAFAQGSNTTVQRAEPTPTETPVVGSWVMRTQNKRGCPALTFYLDRSGDVIKGTVVPIDRSGQSNLSGTIEQGHFRINLTPHEGNGPKGLLEGERRPDGWIVANLTGAGCHDGELRILFSNSTGESPSGG
jgi:hypothetical protein